MKKILCFGYRDWALRIYDRLANEFDSIFLIGRSSKQYSVNLIYQFNPDLILFYGWSEIVEKDVIERWKCLMLHPSPLPLYRGGSPIQNQIIAGEIDSAVTIFEMNNDLDAGDILAQKDFKLLGSLEDIFRKIEDIGFELTVKILLNEYQPQKQDNSRATVFKRRAPADSEITMFELQNNTSQYLYNKVRMLADPYPNAFIRTSDGKRLLIKEVKISE